MRLPILATALLATAGLGACTSNGDKSVRPTSVGDFYSNEPGGFVRSSDTYGTGRRVDVFGPQNAPVLPTIGMPGYGK